jgi:hypothetical protein
MQMQTQSRLLKQLETSVATPRTAWTRDFLHLDFEEKRRDCLHVLGRGRGRTQNAGDPEVEKKQGARTLAQSR